MAITHDVSFFFLVVKYLYLYEKLPVYLSMYFVHQYTIPGKSIGITKGISLFTLLLHLSQFWIDFNFLFLPSVFIPRDQFLNYYEVRKCN